METLIIGGVFVVIAVAIAYKIREYLREIKAEQDEIDSTLERLSAEYKESYSFSDVDQKLINDAALCLRRECPHGLAQRLSQYKTHQERKESVKKLVYQMAESMGVELEDVLIEDDMPDGMLGQYQSGYICINAVVMEADPERILMTIAHELRHGVQFQACLEGKDQWGFSTETKAIWYYNIQYYISYPYEKYVKQPIEYDADTFANAVIQSYKS